MTLDATPNPDVPPPDPMANVEDLPSGTAFLPESVAKAKRLVEKVTRWTERTNAKIGTVELAQAGGMGMGEEEEMEGDKKEVVVVAAGEEGEGGNSENKEEKGKIEIKEGKWTWTGLYYATKVGKSTFAITKSGRVYEEDAKGNVTEHTMYLKLPREVQQKRREIINMPPEAPEKKVEWKPTGEKGDITAVVEGRTFIITKSGEVQESVKGELITYKEEEYYEKLPNAVEDKRKEIVWGPIWNAEVLPKHAVPEDVAILFGHQEPLHFPWFADDLQHLCLQEKHRKGVADYRLGLFLAQHGNAKRSVIKFDDPTSIELIYRKMMQKKNVFVHPFQVGKADLTALPDIKTLEPASVFEDGKTPEKHLRRVVLVVDSKTPLPNMKDPEVAKRWEGIRVNAIVLDHRYAKDMGKIAKAKKEWQDFCKKTSYTIGNKRVTGDAKVIVLENRMYLKDDFMLKPTEKERLEIGKQIREFVRPIPAEEEK